MASIQERNGSYRIFVSCGYDVNGKKIVETTTFTPDHSLTPKKQQKAVEEFALKFEEQVKNGMVLDGRKITFKEFSDKWIEEYAKVRLQAGTVKKYQDELKSKIIPFFGHVKLSDVKPHILNSFYVSLIKDGVRKDNKQGGYSVATIRKIHNIISSILRTAVEWEVIDKNPCDKVKPQTVPNISDNIKFFTAEQASIFLSFIEQPYEVKIKGHKRTDDTGKTYMVGDYSQTKTVPLQMQALFNIAIFTGMRKGELLALTWNDVDLDKGTVSISKSVSVVDGQCIIKSPKTNKSYRTVSIPDTVISILQRYKVEQSKYRLQVGSYWHNENLLFTQDNGTMMSYSTPYHSLQDIIERYNKDKEDSEKLPLIPFHGLRHTAATLLIGEKQDLKTVSNRLGHAQTSTTMNIYAHALQENDKKASDVLESLLSKNDTKMKKTSE